MLSEISRNKYDYIIVGSGLYGSVLANRLNAFGKKCLIIEKRAHLGGNIYCENIEGINVHKYGPHIFHTDIKECWDFICSFVDMNGFIYSPLANFKERLYNLPFNMNTFYQLWRTKTPQEAKYKILSQIADLKLDSPQNLEEQAISMVGPDIYNILIKGYTEKQWGRKPVDLPAFIIKRLPLRFVYNNNYFNDRYQGIPIGGYNCLIKGLQKDIKVICNTDYLKHKNYFDKLAHKIIFTGRIDEFFDYKFGRLEYRSLKFEQELLHCQNYQGVAAVNFTEYEVPYTRIIEHKHFEFGVQNQTVITKEYPIEFSDSNEPYYPVNDVANNAIFNKYKELATLYPKYQFGGRLANYCYYDMDDTIMAALEHSKKEMETINI